MNPAKQKIAAALNDLPGMLSPLRAAAERMLVRCSVIDVDGAINIGHRPWKAPENYAIVLFPGVKPDWFDRYATAAHGVSVPKPLRAILTACNGFHFGAMTLFGIPPSMMAATPSIDRTRLSPLDISAASRSWAREYGAPPDLFHFGSRHIASDDLGGYFLHEDGTVSSVSRKQRRVLVRWVSIESMLADEIATAEDELVRGTPDDWWH